LKIQFAPSQTFFVTRMPPDAVRQLELEGPHLLVDGCIWPAQVAHDRSVAGDPRIPAPERDAGVQAHVRTGCGRSHRVPGREQGNVSSRSGVITKLASAGEIGWTTARKLTREPADEPTYTLPDHTAGDEATAPPIAPTHTGTQTRGGFEQTSVPSFVANPYRCWSSEPT
jgi:hypothetical protein